MEIIGLAERLCITNTIKLVVNVWDKDKSCESLFNLNILVGARMKDEEYKKLYYENYVLKFLNGTLLTLCMTYLLNGQIWDWGKFTLTNVLTYMLLFLVLIFESLCLSFFSSLITYFDTEIFYNSKKTYIQIIGIMLPSLLMILLFSLKGY